MRNVVRVVCYVVAMLCLGLLRLLAQGSGQVHTSVTYECVANAHCSISCSTDGEKVLETGSPRRLL